MFKKNNQNKKCYECGIVALFPAIIVSGILIVLCVATSRSFLAFLYRTTIFDEKVQSAVAADACVFRVLAKHIQDDRYAGGETVMIKNDPCTVEVFSVTGGRISVKIGDAVSVKNVEY